MTQCISSGQSVECELAVADDHRQQIIEIVCDSTCQLPDSFHFLCLSELIFELSPFGDIFRYACDAINFPLLIGDWKPAIVNPPQWAVRAHNTIFQIVTISNLAR